MTNAAKVEHLFPKKITYDSPAINEYLDQMENMRKNTYISARVKLSTLPQFASSVYGKTVDDLIDLMKTGKEDRYSVLAAYNKFLRKELKKTAQATRRRVSGARELFEFHSVEFSDRQLRLKVKLERVTRRAKTPTDKEQITRIMEATQDPALLLAELWHAATGRRPEEIFSLRHCDIDTKKRVFRIRGEFTKMGIEQERPMTAELAIRTEKFMVWKHRTRRIVRHKKDGTFDVIIFEPKVRPSDLLFAPYRRDETHVIPSVDNVYNSYQSNLAALLDSIGMGERVNPDDPRSPRKFTFYRLRDHVKTTISDLGYSDFGEWYIGHAGSTYYNQPEAKRMELFRKIEPYLTYLDVASLEARGADQQTQIDQLNEAIKREKMARINLINALLERGSMPPLSKEEEEKFRRLL